jgi:hypothetical protein
MHIEKKKHIMMRCIIILFLLSIGECFDPTIFPPTKDETGAYSFPSRYGTYPNSGTYNTQGAITNMNMWNMYNILLRRDDLAKAFCTDVYKGDCNFEKIKEHFNSLKSPSEIAWNDDNEWWPQNTDDVVCYLNNNPTPKSIFCTKDGTCNILGAYTYFAYDLNKHFFDDSYNYYCDVNECKFCCNCPKVNSTSKRDAARVAMFIVVGVSAPMILTLLIVLLVKCMPRQEHPYPYRRI